MNAETENEQEVKEPEKQPKKKSSKLWTLFVLFILLIIVTAGLFGSMPWWRGYLPAEYVKFLPPVPIADCNDGDFSSAINDNKQTLEEISANISKLEKRIELLEMASDEKDSSLPDVQAMISDIDSKIKQIAKLELSSAGAGTSNIDDEIIEKVSSHTVKISRLVAADSKMIDKVLDIEEDINQLKADKAEVSEIESFSQRIQSIENLAKEVTSRKSKAVALLLATGQLREVVSGGRPFKAELETIKAVSESIDEVKDIYEKIEPFAEEGTPTVPVLKEDFKAMAGKAVWADAKPKEEGWRNKLIGKLMNLVTVRRIDGAGDENSVSNKVTKAEKLLAENELKDAVKELETLKGVAAEIVAPWLKKAHVQITVDEGLAELLNIALKNLSESTGK